ncbi:basal body protein 10-like [Miscanthus floridulus]|uniref:basal body protein 10-like n=1 Tax=Miscanthus floridulus TaxID=154761 RepID=UPI00345B383B
MPDEPIDGIRMSAAPLSDEEVLRRVNEAVEGRQKIGGLSPFPMRPTLGYLSLRRVVNRAYAEAQKKKKDAKTAKHKKKIVERDALEKRRRKQKLEGLPVEASPSTSVEGSSGDDGGEVGQGPLDHLPDVREMVLGASAGGPASQGGGGDGDSGQMSARPTAEADTPETRALGKRAVSPLGSTAEVEQAAMGPAPPRVERAPGVRRRSAGLGGYGDRATAAVAEEGRGEEAVEHPLEVSILLVNRKRQAEVPAFAPRKALKVGTGSIAPGAVEVQELVAQVGATQAVVGREEEEEPTLREAIAPAAVEAAVGAAETPSAVEATEGEVEVEAPSVVEATEGEVEVEAPTVAEALRTSGAEVVEIAAPGNFGAEVVEIAAPGNFRAEVVEAGVSTARAAALEVETEARQASTLPPIQSALPVQGSAREAEVRPIPADNASRGKGVADAGATSVVEQPALASGEGSVALVRVRPELYGWDHPRVWWRSRDDPEGEPIFALEDVAEGGCWDTLEQYRSLAEWSLWIALSVVANDLPGVSQELEARSFGKSLFLRWERGVWDELCRQRELLAHANKLLSARSTEAEDLRLRCDNREAEAATAQGQVAPLAARVKELEEELTRVANERDASNSRAEEVRATAIATAGQLGAEQRAHELMKGALAEATKAAEASQGEALKWREKAKGLDDEVSRLTEASVALQTVLNREIEEHDMLQSAARTVYEALEMEGVQSGSSLRSRLTALIGQARQRLREALHTGVKRALAVVSSHYAGVDVEGVSDGYVLSEDVVEAEEELTRLEAAVEGPGTALAKLFEEEVVPPSPSTDAGDPAP